MCIRDRPNPNLPELQFEPEKPITTPVVKEVYGLEAANVMPVSYTHLVGQLAVLVHHRTVVGTQHELLVEAVAVGGHIVGIGDVVDGHRLRAVFLRIQSALGRLMPIGVAG